MSMNVCYYMKPADAIEASLTIHCTKCSHNHQPPLEHANSASHNNPA